MWILQTYGIAPYLKSNITKSILKAPYFIIDFDESLNSVLQNEQMDIQIKYWSDEDCNIQTRYYDSKFLKRANFDTFCDALLQTLNSYWSMDGPTINWAVLINQDMGRKTKCFFCLILVFAVSM